MADSRGLRATAGDGDYRNLCGELVHDGDCIVPKEQGMDPARELPDAPCPTCGHWNCRCEDVEGVCAYAGHEWANAGGGLLICTVCDEEKWAA